MSDTVYMNGKEFIKKVQKLGKKNNIETEVVKRGKGSHQTLYYGTKFTTVQHGELKKGVFNAMCKQLGIKKTDL